MNIEKLFIKETTLKLSVIKVDNKRIIKSIFNQINIDSPFDELYTLKQNVKFLGYINEKKKWIIWKNNDFLFKYDLGKIYPISQINLNKNTIDELITIFPSEKVKLLHSFQNEQSHFEYRDIEISSVLDPNEQYLIMDVIELVDDIIDEILKRQIFL